MVGHGGSSAGSYLADPTSPIPSHCASIVATSTVRVKYWADEWHFALLVAILHFAIPVQITQAAQWMLFKFDKVAWAIGAET